MRLYEKMISAKSFFYYNKQIVIKMTWRGYEFFVLEGEN